MLPCAGKQLSHEQADYRSTCGAFPHDGCVHVAPRTPFTTRVILSPAKHTPTHLIFGHVELLTTAVRTEDPAAIATVSSADLSYVEKAPVEAVGAERALLNFVIVHPSLARRAFQSSGGHSFRVFLFLVLSVPLLSLGEHIERDGR